MKRLIAYTSALCTMVAFIALHTGKVGAEQPQPFLSMEDQTVIYMQRNQKLSEIVDTMFDVLYRNRSDNLSVTPNEIAQWIRILEDYKEKNPEDIKKVLFLEAECYYRQNDFKKAYAKFYQYKLNMESTDVPFYNVVEERMADLGKYIKLTEPTTRPQKTIRYFMPFFVAVFFILLFLIIYFDAESLKKYGIHKEGYGYYILPSSKIIDLEDMCNQDGRCSYDTVMQYKSLTRENRAALVSQKKEKFEYAQLVVEGHEMIHRVNEKTPLPIALTLLIPRVFNYLIDLFVDRQKKPSDENKSQRLKGSPYLLYPIVGSGLIIIWWLAVHGTEIPDIASGATYVLLAAFVISCFAGIHIMAAKTIDAIDEIVCMLEPDPELKSVKRLEFWVERLFGNPRQYYFFLIVMAIIVYKAYAKGGFTVSIFFYAVLVWLASNLIWFMLGSMIMMNKVYNLNDLSINPLSPSKTIGLEKWISVIGTYNMVCSIVLTFGCAIPVYRNYMAGGNVIGSSFWFFVIAPVLIFNWIYPYIKIGSLVKSKKTRRMNFIKTKISMLFNDWVDSENRILKYIENTKDGQAQSAQTIDRTLSEKKKIKQNLDDMESYYQVFKQIEDSPESYFDLNSALELAKVLGFPSLFAIGSALLSYVLK